MGEKFTKPTFTIWQSGQLELILTLMERDKDLAGEVPRPVAIILENRARLAEKLGIKEVQHTPPAMDHYPHLYPWDSASAAIISSHFGYIRQAETEVFSIFDKQRENGMVPNMQRVPGLRTWDPELLTFTKPRESADYSQPPIWAYAISSIYKTKAQQSPTEANLFLKEIMPPLKASYEYFMYNRHVTAGNPLISNTMPQETGRDSDEALNGYAPKLPSNGPDTPYLVELINTGTDYVGKLALGGLNRINGWNPQKIKRYYALVDPMFNSIYADNLRVVGNLVNESEGLEGENKFHREATWVEDRIFSDLFVPEANNGKGAFLVQNKGPKEEISISSLGPLLLDNLPPPMLQSILDLMDDHFKSPYPLPTISTKSHHYDPEGRRPHRVWNGEVMMIANWLVCLGLRKQGAKAEQTGRADLAARCHDWYDSILSKSKEVLDHGYYEGFSSQTGRPRRAKTVRGNFVWNGLIETL